MYVLVLVTCMTFSGETHCQSFPRPQVLTSLAQCNRAAAIEKGRYLQRIEQRRAWLEYKWQCNAPAQTNLPAASHTAD